jgi:hypothetical protein
MRLCADPARGGALQRTLLVIFGPRFAAASSAAKTAEASSRTARQASIATRISTSVTSGRGPGSGRKRIDVHPLFGGQDVTPDAGQAEVEGRLWLSHGPSQPRGSSKGAGWGSCLSGIPTAILAGPLPWPAASPAQPAQPPRPPAYLSAALLRALEPPWRAPGRLVYTSGDGRSPISTTPESQRCYRARGE